MADLKSMEKYLETISKTNVFITPDDNLCLNDTLELAKLLKKYGINNFRKCFRTQEKDIYTYQIRCDICEDIITLNTNKSALFRNLSKINSYECNKCKKEQEDKKWKEYDRKQQENNISAREYLFNNLLNPEKTWHPKLKLYGKINSIKNCLFFVNKEEVKQFIKEIGYYEYLKTPFWKAIAEQKKKKNNKCQLCGSSHKLNVHHNNYDILGDEVNNLNDLTVLCEDCHYRFHNKEE